VARYFAELQEAYELDVPNFGVRVIKKGAWPQTLAREGDVKLMISF